MCGIFGVISLPLQTQSYSRFADLISSLFLISQSRGSDASGLALLKEDSLTVLKRSVPANQFIKLNEYKELADDYSRMTGIKAAIGHSRMVTNGSRETHDNNQPVISPDSVIIHNGIVVNVNELWEKNNHLQRKYEVDTEIILALIEDYLKSGLPLSEAAHKMFKTIKGAASIAAIFADSNALLVATNNGSLYTLHDINEGVFLFASERHMLIKLISKLSLKNTLDTDKIVHIKAENGIILNIPTLELSCYNFSDTDKSVTNQTVPVSEKNIRSEIKRRNVIDLRPPFPSKTDFSGHSEEKNAELLKWAHSEYPYDTSYSDKLVRCTKCILPETMPFISFNKDGICSYCEYYKQLTYYGEDSLFKLADSIRSDDGKYDCIVGLSGGRDSMYGLHYIKNILKLNPLAYTYDWGMVTDLARRNISRICGKLGVEHLLVSANIQDKRRYVQKNVNAWMKNPDLGMIPLFMAGDKAYFYHATRIKKEHGISTIFLCENMLERTDFKIGFAGLRPSHIDPDRHYTLSQSSILQLGSYYARQYLLNPAYLNESLLDTMFAYACYYLIKRDYHNLYRFIPWEENKIISTLVSEYEWEMAEDTVSTWRIGDGTSAFYNYAYYHVAGFTENDTFRSNQIREGIMSREEAIKLCREENKPRFLTIQWYCNTINVDFRHLINTVNSIPRLKP